MALQTPPAVIPNSTAGWNWTNADTGEEFPPKQNYYVGGNTKFYGAILFRFRERDFRQIQHVDGVSPTWPLSYADFEPWYTPRGAPVPRPRPARRRPRRAAVGRALPIRRTWPGTRWTSG